MKEQDIELLCLLISNQVYRNATQQDIAFKLKRSVATVNASLKRLDDSNIIIRFLSHIKYFPHIKNCLDLLPAVRFLFPENKNLIKLAEESIPLLIDLRNKQF